MEVIRALGPFTTRVVDALIAKITARLEELGMGGATKQMSVKFTPQPRNGSRAGHLKSRGSGKRLL
jgi:hypothetical protein